MDYVVERMRLAGCSEIRIVTRPEKRDVIRRALALGAVVIEEYPESAAASLARGVAGGSPHTVVLFGFPDTIWQPDDGFSRLLARLDEGCDVVLGLFRTRDVSRSDIVTLGEGGLVKSISVKPQKPASNLIWGCGAARAHALSGLKEAGEPGRHFDVLCRRQPVFGVELSDKWIDIGTKEALARARAEISLTASSRAGKDVA
jgi:glucose-1-phosphate thymidylyltransferase